MSRWRIESGYIGRYAGSGLLNTAAGFSAIFLLMALGAPLLVANVAGYAVGFLLGFVVSKKMVFRSNGAYAREGMRYLLSFGIAFLANLAALGAALHVWSVNGYVAQVAGAVAYTASMYILSRYFVFGSPAAARQAR
jgi:putative flippase GtrA